MTDTQDKILEGANNMYENTGEMVPTKLFSNSDLDVLVEAGSIAIASNPYGIGDDFFGIKGKEYPDGFKELIDFRSMRDSLGSRDTARQLVKCIKL